MKRLTVLSLFLCLLLSACVSSAATVQEPAAEPEKPPVSSGFVAAPVTATVKEDSSASAGKKTDPGDLTPDPPYAFDIDTMQPSDFGAYFTGTYTCENETYSLLSGEPFQNEVFAIHGAESGPTVYVIAGVHGDEEAAWQTGKLLKKISLKAGSLYIVAPANPWGAAKVPKSRYTDSKDLNRAFPGSATGTNAQRVAWAYYNDVKAKKPDFVFDLHEAVVIEEGRDYLGSSLIYTDMSLFETRENGQYNNLFMNVVFATEAGELCSMPFRYFSPGPEGSVNRSISEGLHIPVVTVETYRGYQMEERISDQLAIVQYVLQQYGMVD